MSKRRVLVLVFAAFSLTCSAPQRGKTPGTIADESGAAPASSPTLDEVQGELQRPDGDLVSSRPRARDEGGYRAPSIVTDEATSAHVPLESLPKASSAPAASPPRISPASPADLAGPRKKAAVLEPLSGGARISKTLSKERHDSVAVSDVETTGGAPSAPAMKAGRHDDNKEYNRFLAFLAEHYKFAAHTLDVSERLVLRTVDRDGHSLPNCEVRVGATAAGSHQQSLAQSITLADGRTQFFPAAVSGPNHGAYAVRAQCGGTARTVQVERNGRRETEIRFDFARKLPAGVPVDVAIVLDTTGSMQGQIDRLKQTLKAIHYQLTSLPTRPDIRFGMVAYRDRGDEYLTRVTPLTSDIKAYQKMLDVLIADGGGDRPEDLQTALAAAMHKLAWRADALRIGFIISDAPPHAYPDADYTYLDAMKEGLRRGIKWVSVGAGGLGLDGEVVFRQIAQFTMGEYVFVTQGGGGDSAGGTGEASHHVGANYSTENLDQAIVRIVRRELSYLTTSPKDFDTTIVATGTPSTPREQILAPAVAESIRQLADYSALKLANGTPVAIVPVTASEAKHKAVAEYLTDQMILSASRNPSFKVVERDLSAVTQEMKLQLSNLFDASGTVPIGKMVGAELLVVSKLVIKGTEAELFAKLVRVSTGEVLSVANVRVTGGAGFGS